MSSATRRLVSRDLALIALFAALIAALGLPGSLYLFGGGVPVTAQSMGIMLAGSILGARRGFLAVLALLALVAAGLPLLAGGRGGLGVFVGLSAGYLAGWALGAWVTGWLTERTVARGGKYSLPLGLVANLVGGIGVVYAIGIPVQAWLGDTSGIVATAVAATIFLPGDLIKATIATLIAKGVHTGYPTLGTRTPATTVESGRDEAPRSGA